MEHSGKTVLVTGSEGNIGCYVVGALQRRHPQWKIIRVKNGNAAPFYDHAHGYYVGDLRKTDILDLIFKEHAIDYVMHAASTSYSHAGYKSRPFQILHNDCTITLNVLQYAGGVKKFVYLSSALAYEHASDALLVEEITDRLPAPTSSYGVAKYLGEQAVLQAHRERGTNYTIWRPFNIVSPLEPMDGEGRHVFVDFARRLLVERVDAFQVLGSGQQVRCFLWVEEAAECMVAALENPATDHQVINLARDEPISLVQLKELLVRIGKELGVLPANYDPPVRMAGTFAGVEMEARIPSTGKLKSLTGWQSLVSVEECFRKFVGAKLQSRQLET